MTMPTDEPPPESEKPEGNHSSERDPSATNEQPGARKKGQAKKSRKDRKSRKPFHPRIPLLEWLKYIFFGALLLTFQRILDTIVDGGIERHIMPLIVQYVAPLYCPIRPDWFWLGEATCNCLLL